MNPILFYKKKSDLITIYPKNHEGSDGSSDSEEDVENFLNDKSSNFKSKSNFVTEEQCDSDSDSDGERWPRPKNFKGDDVTIPASDISSPEVSYYAELVEGVESETKKIVKRCKPVPKNVVISERYPPHLSSKNVERTPGKDHQCRGILKEKNTVVMSSSFIDDEKVSAISFGGISPICPPVNRKYGTQSHRRVESNASEKVQKMLPNHDIGPKATLLQAVEKKKVESKFVSSTEGFVKDIDGKISSLPSSKDGIERSNTRVLRSKAPDQVSQPYQPQKRPTARTLFENSGAAGFMKMAIRKASDKQSKGDIGKTKEVSENAVPIQTRVLRGQRLAHMALNVNCGDSPLSTVPATKLRELKPSKPPPVTNKKDSNNNLEKLSPRPGGNESNDTNIQIPGFQNGVDGEELPLSNKLDDALTTISESTPDVPKKPTIPPQRPRKDGTFTTEVTAKVSATGGAVTRTLRGQKLAQKAIGANSGDVPLSTFPATTPKERKSAKPAPVTDKKDSNNNLEKLSPRPGGNESNDTNIQIPDSKNGVDGEELPLSNKLDDALTTISRSTPEVSKKSTRHPQKSLKDGKCTTEVRTKVSGTGGVVTRTLRGQNPVQKVLDVNSGNSPLCTVTAAKLTDLKSGKHARDEENPNSNLKNVAPKLSAGGKNKENDDFLNWCQEEEQNILQDSLHEANELAKSSEAKTAKKAASNQKLKKLRESQKQYEDDDPDADLEEILSSDSHEGIRARDASKYGPMKSKRKSGKVQKPVWTNNDLNINVRDLRNNFTVPTELKEPIAYFEYYFDDEILQLIVEQTNLYSMQRNSESLNLNVKELKAFLGIFIYMGICSLPSVVDYWAQTTRVNQVAEIMPRARFQKIRSHLHFHDNSSVEPDGKDRYIKIRPLLDHLRKKCENIEQEKELSVDECMVGYKGKFAGNLRQYLPQKPSHKWGFKFFVLAGKSGMTYAFIPYQGDTTFDKEELSEEEAAMGVGASAVIALAKTIKDQLSASITFDNWYTGLPLLRYLRNEMGILAMGTINAHRTDKCPLMSDNKLMAQGRGSFDFKSSEDGTVVVKWADNKCVMLASTRVGVNPVGSISRYVKGANAKVPVPCPQVVLSYNSTMGGVDLSDMLMAISHCPTKSRRWYFPIFGYCLDMSVTNAYLSYRRDCNLLGEKQIYKTSKEFRIRLYQSLVSPAQATKGRPSLNKSLTKLRILKPVAARPSPDLRYDELGHFMVNTDKGRCRYCQKGFTIKKCSKCDMRLCFTARKNCFAQFHLTS